MLPFDDTSTSTSRGVSRRVPAAPTRELLGEFDRLHRARLGVPAIIHGAKDGQLLAALWRQQGTAMVQALLAAFFASDDPYIRRRGFTVGVFISQAGRLLAERQMARPASARDWRDECAVLHGGRCTNVHFHLAKKEAS